MSRAASPLTLALTLSLGVTIGLLAGRFGPVVSAQQAPRPSSPPVVTAPPAGSEEAVYRDLARQYETVQHFDKSFALVAKVVSPAVVHIVANKSARREDGNVTQFTETGSGVIVRAESGRDCYVLTNNHVVDGASANAVNIYLHDGRVLRPERFWSDTKADVAVVKLGRTDLPTARLGNSDEVAIGHWVLALGSPFGLTHSVSQGIISARGRHEQELEDDGVENQDFLQTDAAINPGNSGGPLVNLKGEVIGLNTAIASNGGGSEGVGFSIPINLAKWIMAQLVSTGRVSRGAMGVKLHELLPQKAAELGLERPRGARIQSVQPTSPAAVAGLRGGDVILQFNGADVLDFNHLINLVSMTPIGQKAEVVYWRDKQSHKVAVTVADRDAVLASEPGFPARRSEPNVPLRRSPRPEIHSEPSSAPTANALGLDLLTMDAKVARVYHLPENLRGVAVAKVDPQSPLSTQVHASDVITSVGGQAVQNADDAARLLTRRRGREPLEVGIQRAIGGAMQQFKIQVP